MVEVLLAGGADKNQGSSQDGQTPLLVSVANEQIPVTKLLIKVKNLYFSQVQTKFQTEIVCKNLLI